MARAVRSQNPGYHMMSGNAMNQWLGQPMLDSNPGLTALAGGGQTGATLLQLGTNEVTTVASGSDSVQLPLADGNSVVVVRNAGGSNSLQVFGNQGGSDTINGTAGSTGIAVANAKTVIFFSMAVGKWYTVLTA